LDYLLTMRLFVRSVELGSFSKAAIAQNLTASSVSRHIASLEQDLGVSLFRRSTRQLLLTDVGMVFFEKATQILADVEEARRSTLAASGEPVGTLKLWAPSEFGEMHIAPLIPAFMAATPGLSVDLTLAAEEQNSSASQYDISIILGEPPESRFFSHKFARNQYAICCAPSYLKRALAPDFPSALQEHNCLLHADDSTWRFGSARSTVEVAITVSGNFRSNRLQPVLKAALAGAGFARLPFWLIGPHVRDGRLVTILGNYEPLATDNGIYGIYPERRSSTPKLRAFMDFITARIGAPPCWERGS
jgi:DNA-binding transcriptional LysR family regulator